MTITKDDWVAIGSIVGTSLGIANLVITLSRWRWERRPDEVHWDIDEAHEIDPDTDRARFPATFAKQNPNRGEHGIMVRVRFSGRHSLRVLGLSYVWSFATRFPAPITPITLEDGQGCDLLIFTREVAMDQITSITIHGDGGRTFTQDVNKPYHRTFKAHVGEEDP